jgi:ubiquinone biosynthesis accessory factor UbiJ
MVATPSWLGSVEALLNRYIGASEQAAAIARRLEDRSLQIEVTGIVRIRLIAATGRLALLAGDDSTADAVISGTPPALLQLFTGGLNRDAARPAARIRGDAEIANLYRQLLTLAQPDWEEELSRFIGDFPARRVSQFADRVRNFARRVHRTAGENIAEYLQEESQDLVNRTELDEFLHGVDQMRDTADRIEVRLARLERRSTGAD